MSGLRVYHSPCQLLRVWQNSEVDIILFTSQQGMYNSSKLSGQLAHHCLRTILWLVINRRLAEEACKSGAEK
ncbi:hypothetical protein [Legionella genomosp. 1]|uniref:hypothetical protein n=1 Tax=Legionella genomosp. 1 TaxID=1093625 RepID=UPI0013EFB58F|nr:hypothetical protein [Legionella genomosp. 1]